jgi:2-amino-4-hydroxy-6-hydroxymethyldihydropteridine diphosphokinase
MSDVALALGSNLGDRLQALRRAVEVISEQIGAVAAKSDVYETAPWGRTSQPFFLNACLVVETDMPPLVLLGKIKEIECEIGRIKRAYWGPREIDIDIIFYDDLVLDDPKLIIPHKLMEMRSFVMAPLADVAPDWRHPRNGWTVGEFYRGMSNEGIVRMARL